MVPTNRREFLSDVGRGMLTVGLGASLANDLGFSHGLCRARFRFHSARRTCGSRRFDAEYACPKLQPLLAKKILKGETDTKKLIAAGALANAVTFGGCDYVGFHTAMAMLPALEMSRQLGQSGTAPRVEGALPKLCNRFNRSAAHRRPSCKRCTMPSTPPWATWESRFATLVASATSITQSSCWPPANRRATCSTRCSRPCRTI